MTVDSVVVFALIDDEPGDAFLIGVFATQEGAKGVGEEWNRPCHIEILELEP